MKFRMAENSVFAVLLRSQWWISFVVAAGVVVVTQSLVPVEYRNLASMGAFPFVVIGCIAFARQWREPGEKESETLLAQARAMAWPAFEAALRRGFEREGRQVRPATGGADLLLEGKGGPTLVSARRWKAARHGEEAVQALAKAMRAQDVGRGAYVALGELTPQAAKLAREEGIEVLGGAALVKLLRA
ncbi:restriction endonuclease [Ramlibacter humi]|uniref:Restriction endonuclease n=1 Tax=Ramlibacter humi TaxID=2530451 RepID=A0A4Z0CBA1_9BURK|nr:restriction endonuclease [Ramlibacter humi]TFZ07640.1 restriction endonuclease [Ramlibacter humi]